MNSKKPIKPSIVIGNQSLKKLSLLLHKRPYTSYFILCDENTIKHCLPVLVISCPALADAQLIEIESGEKSKSIEICQLIWQSLIEQSADKNSLLINLGGGVVTDLGGFVASVYKRGIDFISIPTTLMAMADASIGGKNGIDFLGIKNALGIIKPANGVFIYPPFLQTLSQRHLNNGWVEIFKIALVCDKKFWLLLKKHRLSEMNAQFIGNSVLLKNKIVLKDPFDNSVRKILNFGHSIGHAVESLFLGSKQELLHGEAICIGMLIESEVAYLKKLITKTELHDIKKTLAPIQAHIQNSAFNFKDIEPFLKQDKKNKKASYRFALVNKIGACLYDLPVSETQIIKAIQAYHHAND